jgi:hypothetical protein
MPIALKITWRLSALRTQLLRLIRPLCRRILTLNFWIFQANLIDRNRPGDLLAKFTSPYFSRQVITSS